MRYLEAKALEAEGIENKNAGPPDATKWEAEISPEAYLGRWPDGPKADLARRIIEAREQ